MFAPNRLPISAYLLKSTSVTSVTSVRVNSPIPEASAFDNASHPAKLLVALIEKPIDRYRRQLIEMR